MNLGNNRLVCFSLHLLLIFCPYKKHITEYTCWCMVWYWWLVCARSSKGWFVGMKASSAMFILKYKRCTVIRTLILANLDKSAFNSHKSRKKTIYRLMNQLIVDIMLYNFRKLASLAISQQPRRNLQTAFFHSSKDKCITFFFYTNVLIS